MATDPVYETGRYITSPACLRRQDCARSLEQARDQCVDRQPLSSKTPCPRVVLSAYLCDASDRLDSDTTRSRNHDASFASGITLSTSVTIFTGCSQPTGCRLEEGTSFSTHGGTAAVKHPANVPAIAKSPDRESSTANPRPPSLARTRRRDVERCTRINDLIDQSDTAHM
jgi:hypothetical protein